MKTLNPYVKCLGSMDYRKDAWKTSRPKFTEENLHFDKISDMDLSLNSMLVYTIEMRSSVIVRDLIFSLRPIEGWALSTRSMPINLDTVCLSDEFGDDIQGYYDIKSMFEQLNKGVSRDRVRGMLPLGVSSTYTFTIDYRMLMSFCKTMEKLSTEIFNIYCINLLFATGNLENYKTTTVGSCEEYYIISDEEKINGLQRAGNMIFGHYKMKMALASQFLRQHYSKIKIGLWNNLKNYTSIRMCQDDLIDVAFYIDVNSYRRLMSMRSHWVIDWSDDMWGGICGDYVKDMTAEEFWNFIPNGGGKEDPYWADVYNRVLREDPGVPCPIMCEWPEMIERKEAEVGDSILMRKYKLLVDEGFIKDNPNNIHRQKYLSLGEAK